MTITYNGQVIIFFNVELLENKKTYQNFILSFKVMIMEVCFDILKKFNNL